MKSNTETIDSIFRSRFTDFKRLTMRFGITEEDSEDFIQDTFVKVMAKDIPLATFDNPYAWLVKVLSNHSLTFLRKRKTGCEIDLEILPDNTEDKEIEEQTLSKLEEVLTEHRDDPRYQIIKLHYFDRKKFREISNILGMPLNTTISHHRRFKAQLKQDFIENTSF